MELQAYIALFRESIRGEIRFGAYSKRRDGTVKEWIFYFQSKKSADDVESMLMHADIDYIRQNNNFILAGK